MFSTVVTRCLIWAWNTFFNILQEVSILFLLFNKTCDKLWKQFVPHVFFRRPLCHTRSKRNQKTRFKVDFSYHFVIFILYMFAAVPMTWRHCDKWREYVARNGKKKSHAPPWGTDLGRGREYQACDPLIHVSRRNKSGALCRTRRRKQSNRLILLINHQGYK